MRAKYLYVMLLTCAFSSTAFGKEPTPGRAEADTNARKPSFYLGLATGLNNSTGFFGVTGEIHVQKRLNIIAGLGLGTWGFKPMIGLRYYFDYPYRYAIGMTYSYAMGTGKAPIALNLDVIDTAGAVVNKPIPVIVKGISVLNFTAMKFWRVGKQHRFNVEVGYSVPLDDGYGFRIMSNDFVTRESISVLHQIQPGGLILGASFSFGL